MKAVVEQGNLTSSGLKLRVETGRVSESVEGHYTFLTGTTQTCHVPYTVRTHSLYDHETFTMGNTRWSLLSTYRGVDGPGSVPVTDPVCRLYSAREWGVGTHVLRKVDGPEPCGG